ncbi:hypothetical protein C8R43DRAFT_1105187 [Mycena crocata]|nr:hypothetical protein C8R43DRAFT_1105187 [Mycena crocata]
MSTYWDTYPDFVHNPTAPLQQEFRRLAEERGWTKGGSRYKKEWGRCGRDEFAHHFGRDDNRLAGWQAMCVMVGVEDAPDSIKRCKEVLRNGIWVNIFDLVDAKRTGLPVKQHSSEAALRNYTKRTKKIFPKHIAKGNPFLRVLLIELL